MRKLPERVGVCDEANLIVIKNVRKDLRLSIIEWIPCTFSAGLFLDRISHLDGLLNHANLFVKVRSVDYPGVVSVQVKIVTGFKIETNDRVVVLFSAVFAVTTVGCAASDSVGWGAGGHPSFTILKLSSILSCFSYLFDIELLLFS
jgi:hypothetical protein